MIKIAICDDDINELSHMVQLLDQYRTTRHVNSEYMAFQNGFELIAALEKGKQFDVYCLDIMMPGFSGIEVAQEIRDFDKQVPILFFTSSPEFALAGYSVNAINYVLKPITREKFFSALDGVLERINIAQDDAILVKSSEGIQKILLPNLVYVEVIGRNVFYHLISGKAIECTESFTAASESLLKYTGFIKTHRSYIVNMKYVDTIDNKRVVLQTLASIPVAQTKVQEFKERYLAFQMEGE